MRLAILAIALHMAAGAAQAQSRGSTVTPYQGYDSPPPSGNLPIYDPPPRASGIMGGYGSGGFSMGGYGPGLGPCRPDWNGCRDSLPGNYNRDAYPRDAPYTGSR